MSTENTSAMKSSYTAKTGSTEDAVYDAAVEFLEYAAGGATLDEIQRYVENARVWSTDVSAVQVRRLLERSDEVSIGITGIYENGEPMEPEEREVRPAYFLDQ